MSAAARAWSLAGILCAAIVAADQAAKARIEADLIPGEVVDVLGPLKLTLAHNTGVAFGLAGGAGIGLVAVTLGALVLIGYLFSRKPERPWMWVAVGLLAGGALGNLVDRIRADAVTDYIDVGSWPPFNLADVAITSGVLLLVLLYLLDAETEDG
ncbi:MAG TPA: signal peptidase II [Solirubrobacterales bacterium]|nr:signal peptidase II [Solirubrobacterales bacterium]